MILKIGAPVLSCSWNSENTKLYIGCADNTLRSIDLATSQIIIVGKHNHAVKDVFFIPMQNAIMSTSYDKIINIWQQGNPNPVLNFPVNHKVYNAAFKYPIFVGGMSEEKILLFDITNINIKSYL